MAHVYNFHVFQGFMMLVWLGVELQFLLFFFTLPSSQDLNSTAAPRPPPLLKNEVFSHQVPVSRQGSINHPGGTSSSATGSDGRVYSGDSQESTPLLPHRRRETQPLIQTSQPNLLVRIFWPLAWRIWDLVQEEIVVLLFALFVILFNQSCLEVGSVQLWSSSLVINTYVIILGWPLTTERRIMSNSLSSWLVFPNLIETSGPICISHFYLTAKIMFIN